MLHQHWATPPCSRCAGIGAHVGAGITAHDHRNPQLFTIHERTYTVKGQKLFPSSETSTASPASEDILIQTVHSLADSTDCEGINPKVAWHPILAKLLGRQFRRNRTPLGP